MSPNSVALPLQGRKEGFMAFSRGLQTKAYHIYIYIYIFLLSYIFNIYIYKEDLALNNLQWLICHKIQPTQIIYI